MKKYDISKFSPCKDGVDYYSTQKDFETVWNNCDRGDWMLWIASKLDVDSRKLFLAKGHCANLVRHLMKDERSTKAVDAAIAYGNGEISKEELQNSVAYDAAYDASSAAYDAYAAYAAAHAAAHAAHAAAADAAAYDSHAAYDAASAYAAASAAAHAAAAAADDAYDAAYAAYAAAHAAAHASADAYAKIKIYQDTADICRKYLTDEVMNKVK